MTLGVRAIVVNDQGAIFLVRHTYVPGWHLPGGGVEWGQTAEEALTAELLEEGHLELLAPPVLLGVYAQRSVSRRDHVLLYLATRIRQTRSRLPDREIAESGFFALDALPADTTRATRHRLAEWQGDEPRSPVWDASHGASQAREA
jgi:ADP-ribose pyrophosphatase YjhB (NUDIX family)